MLLFFGIIATGFVEYLGYKGWNAQIFSRRFSWDKCPTITMPSFFRQPSELTLYVPFVVNFNWFRGNPAVAGSSPCSSQKLRTFAKPDESEGSPLYFSAQIFFENLSMSPKGPPSFFRNFATNLSFKGPKGPPSHLSARWYCSKCSIFVFFYRNFQRMFSEGPLRLFWYFATGRALKIPKGLPFNSFRLWDCLKILIFRLKSEVFSIYTHKYFFQ